MMKMKLNKKIAGASAMLMLSATMLGTSTFAWFTMNKEVEVTNMQVRALAEDGLLVNEAAAPGDTWDEEATAAQTAASKLSMLHPASTADGATWYHAASTKYNDAAAADGTMKSAYLVNGDYETLGSLTAITDMSNATASAGTMAAFSTMGATANSAAGYYVHYTYYLKTSAQSTINLDPTGSYYVSIKSVTATPTVAAGSGSADLDKSLRVGIRMKDGGRFYIYNPLNGTNSYTVNATTGVTTIAGGTATPTDLASLPAVSANGTPVEVYIWYEGEDVNCKSSNATAATLDNIKVDIKFELTGAEAVPTSNSNP
ncbi:MAG: hypothetical protein IJH82_09615 [Lachnospiraceae bacterium]|nr:hypothetical protein [Lachnospiraceae bacterium]